MSVYSLAAGALNYVIFGIKGLSEESYSVGLQKLYLKYIRLIPSSGSEDYVLGPRAFFIYLVQKATTPYDGTTLERMIKEMVRNSRNMDLRPTEIIGGKHIKALNLFIMV